MVFCPRCRSEYRAGFTTCADCGGPLVEELPPEPAPQPSRGGRSWVAGPEAEIEGEDPEAGGRVAERGAERGAAQRDPAELALECAECGAPLPYLGALCAACSAPEDDEDDEDEDEEDDQEDEEDDDFDQGESEPDEWQVAAAGASANPSSAAPAAVATRAYVPALDAHRTRELFRAARALAFSAVLLPWIVAPFAFARASRALADYQQRALMLPELERDIRRVRLFAAALAFGSWATLLAFVAWRFQHPS